MRIGIALAGCAMIALAGPAAAETLREALAQVYQGNPTLSGARAQQRATDEGVPIAKSQALPQVSATGAVTRYPVNDTSVVNKAATLGLNLSVPLYSGGQVRNSIKAAEERVGQGRASLRNSEATVFTDAVGAYMNVIRDTAIVDLNRGNVRVLETNLSASRDRFEVGDLTRTDVAQSEARLAIARSQLQTALSQLDSSRENYLQVVGAAPADLEAPPPLPQFPPTPDDAVDVAIVNNPALQAAKAAASAAGYDVKTARSQRLPRIAAVANGTYYNYLGSFDAVNAGNPFNSIANTQLVGTVGAQLTLPLYQGGGPSARVRQAQATQSVALEQITATERSVVAQARTNYSLYIAALAVITSSEQAVSANELALEGVRAENTVGTRNVLDVLNAEQELLNSRVQLVTARRDAYVAGFALLAALGKAEAKDLGLDGGPLYDPTANYRRVRNQFNDWHDDPHPLPVATTTVGVPSPTQNAVQQNRAAAAGQPGSPPPTGTQTAPTAPKPVVPRAKRRVRRPATAVAPSTSAI